MRFLLILLVALFIFGCTMPGGQPPSATPTPTPQPAAGSQQPTPQQVAPQPTINKISLGSSFGMCAGYCITSLQITKDQVFYKKIGIPDPEARQYRPELNTTTAFSEKEWNELVALIDLAKLEKLPATIGCPDCVDQGAEILQVDYDGKNKSVSFSYGENPDGLEILTKLREIRDKMEEKLAEPIGFEIYQDFDTVSKGQNGLGEKKSDTIDNSKDFEALWNNLNSGRLPKPVLPEVDFDNEIVIAVFLGLIPTGGYGIEIAKVTEKKDKLEVLVLETVPEGCIVTEAFTSPYHIIKTKKTSKNVVFETIQQKTCDPNLGAMYIN